MIHNLARTLAKTLPTPRRLRGMSTTAVERVVDVETLIERVTPVFLPTSQAGFMPFLIPKEAKEHMAAQLQEEGPQEEWPQDQAQLEEGNETYT